MPSYANTVMLDSECLEILRDKPAKKKSEYIRKAIKNYKKAIKIADVQELGDVMVNQLAKLFSEKVKNTIH